MGTGGASSKCITDCPSVTEAPIGNGAYHFVSWLKAFNNPVAYTFEI